MRTAVTSSSLATIAFLNVCSIQRKVTEVQSFLSSRGVHVLGVAETWLKPSIADGELLIPHYKLFRKDREAQHGGGIAVYCHDSLQIRRRTDLESPALELMWIDIGTGNSVIRLGCGYRPPNKPVSYWEVFDQNIQGACEGSHMSTVLIGDFNVDFTSPSCAAAAPLFEITTRSSLTNYVSSPTRVTSHSKTMLDLFFSSSAIHGPCETVQLDISDHYAVLAHVTHTTKTPKQSSEIRSRRLHKVNWDRFEEDLQVACNVSDVVDIDTATSEYIAGIIGVLDKHAPIVIRRRKERRPCPWLTDELVACVRARNSAHRRLMKDRTNEELRQVHRIARSTARKLDRKLKNLYFMKQCETSDQRRLWSVMNDVTGRRKQRQDPKVPIQTLSRAFGEVVHDPLRPGKLSAHSGPAHAEGFTSFDAVSRSDVEQCLRAVDPTKATGSDLVPGSVLRQCAQILSYGLTTIINFSLRTGKVPLSFKLSHISPLYKSGDVASAKNYRPVSLLPIISRILEYFVKKQITCFLDRMQLLPPTQFAYRKNHSTEDALVLATNRWLMARTQHRHTGVIMVDMSKAFDRVQHARMISVLFELGVSGVPLLWFCSYLSDRVQRVRVKDSLSEAVPCLRGVPQGSVLGPLLFVLYTSSITDAVPQSICHQEFADDIVLDYSHSDPAVVCTALTQAITDLASWLNDIGLVLNSAKTQVMFLRPRGYRDGPCSVSCGDSVLEVTHKAKYLGVIIDDQLSWRSHVEHLERKCAMTIGQLWRHGRCLSLRARRMWFIGMILSHVIYASNCFFPCLTNLLLVRLKKIFKAGVRAILQVPRRTHTAPLISMLNLSTLDFIFRQKVLCFVFRCLHKLSSTLLHGYFQCLSATVLPTAAERRTTRGQASLLLSIPFLRGPSGRSTIHFLGSCLWNALPEDIRKQQCFRSFKASLNELDLESLSP